MRPAQLAVDFALSMGARAQDAALARFLALNSNGSLATPAGKALLTEEAKDWPASVGRLAPRPDRLIRVGSDFVAARVQGLDAKGTPVVDLYLYLRRERASWRIVALRTLARTGIVAQAREALRHKPILTSEESAELLNMDLVLSSDRALRLYFAGHRPLLDGLAARTRGGTPAPHSSPT